MLRPQAVLRERSIWCYNTGTVKRPGKLIIWHRWWQLLTVTADLPPKHYCLIQELGWIINASVQSLPLSVHCTCPRAPSAPYLGWMNSPSSSSSFSAGSLSRRCCATCDLFSQLLVLLPDRFSQLLILLPLENAEVKLRLSGMGCETSLSLMNSSPLSLHE